MLPLISCAQNALEPACAVVSNISYYENLWQDVEFACRKPLAFLNFLLPDGGGHGGDGEVVVVRWWWWWWWWGGGGSGGGGGGGGSGDCEAVVVVVVVR